MKQFRSRRVPAFLPVSIHTSVASRPVRMSSDNISMSGMFVKTLLDFKLGSLLLCTFRLPGRKTPFSLVSKVVRKIDEPGTALERDSGIGLEFIDSSSLEKKQLVQYIHTMEISDSMSENDWFDRV